MRSGKLPGLILAALTVVLAACSSPGGQRSTPSSQQRSLAPSQRGLLANHWLAHRVAPGRRDGPGCPGGHHPQGYQLGFSGLKLPGCDLAKFGYLYLNGGRWDTTQVIPADYVAASTRPHSTPPPDAPAEGYGYQWWVTSQARHPSFLAVGYGGQLVQVVPDLDLVVVITSDPTQHRNDAGALVGQAIIPAVTG